MSIQDKITNAKPTTWLVDGMTQEEVRECIDNGKIKCAVLNALEDVKAEIDTEYKRFRNKSDKWDERANGIGTALEIIDRKIAAIKGGSHES